MPLPSITLRNSTSNSVRISKKNNSRSQKVKSKTSSKNGSKQELTKIKKTTLVTSNVKRPSQVQNAKTLKTNTNNRLDRSNVKRPTIIKRSSTTVNGARMEIDSLSSDDTFETNRKKIMAEQIISMHGDSIDQDYDYDSDCDNEFKYDKKNRLDTGEDQDSESIIESDRSDESDTEYEDTDIKPLESDVLESDGSESLDTELLTESDDNHDSDSEESSIDTEIQKRRTEFLDHIEEVVETIKNMKGGDEEEIKADPSYDKCATVKRNNRFNTYIFTGHGCKNLLRVFMKKTIRDPKFGYKRIVQILDKSDYRRFMPINDWRQFWTSYASEPIRLRRLFEVILSDMPCKPYLDIEWEVDADDLESYGSVKRMNFTKFIDKLCRDIIEVFDERYKIDIDESNIMISSSHSDKKVSFHVVINKIIDGSTVSYHTNLRTEHGSAWDLCNSLIEMDENYIGKLDEAVYTTDREFRAIFSNKNESDFRPIAPYSPKKIKLTKNSRIEMDVDECLKYIITYAENDMYHLIEVPDNDKSYMRYNPKFYSSTSSKARYGSGSTCNTGYDDIFRFIPQVYDDQEINELIDLVKDIHPSAYYTGATSRGRWRFTYKDRSEPCYTGNYHDSNGFYVFKNEETGRIYMKCMSDSCRTSHTLRKARSRTYSKRLKRRS